MIKISFFLRHNTYLLQHDAGEMDSLIWNRSKSKQSRLPSLPTPSSADREEEKEQKDDTALVFSSESSQFADYTTWKGIENRTGIEREHAYNFVLKELLDNAVDDTEVQHIAATSADIDTRPPKIHVTIKKTDPREKIIRIVVVIPTIIMIISLPKLTVTLLTKPRFPNRC
jgi:hypothetical protein